MNVKFHRVVSLLIVAGLAAFGCGQRKEKSPTSGQAVTNAAAAVATGEAAPPAIAVKSGGQPADSRAKEGQEALKETRMVIQQTVTNLLDVARLMYEMEESARAQHADLKAAYDELNRAREAYDAKLAALPEMKPLAERRDELQEVYRKMSERKQLLEQEKRTP